MESAVPGPFTVEIYAFPYMASEYWKSPWQWSFFFRGLTSQIGLWCFQVINNKRIRKGHRTSPTLCSCSITSSYWCNIAWGLPSRISNFPICQCWTSPGNTAHNCSHFLASCLLAMPWTYSQRQISWWIDDAVCFVPCLICRFDVIISFLYSNIFPHHLYKHPS